MLKPYDYKQGDSKWGDVLYAVDGESSTIKSAGCGPTAMADIIASLVSPYVDPLTLASWSRMHGYKVYKSGTSYSFPVAVAQAYGVSCVRLNLSNVYGKPNNNVHNVALEQLKSGNWLLACMGKGNWTSSGHYIIIYGYDEKTGLVHINDPASNKANRACNTFALLRKQVKYYWAIQVPDEIKKNGIKKDGAYSQEEFVREVQMCLKSNLTGKGDGLTLSKTVTVSAKKNKKHAVVYPVQKLLKKIGIYHNVCDRSCGAGTTAAINKYQKDVLMYAIPDGEITAKQKMWRSLLRV